MPANDIYPNSYYYHNIGYDLPCCESDSSTGGGNFEVAGAYASDEDAFADGVAEDNVYELSQPNVFGLASGFLRLRKSLLVVLLLLMSMLLYGQDKGFAIMVFNTKVSMDAMTPNLRNGSEWAYCVEDSTMYIWSRTDSVWNRYSGDRVTVIASSPDTSTITNPIQGDIAYISSDSMWIRGNLAWLFSSGGGGGSVDSTIYATIHYVDSLRQIVYDSLGIVSLYANMPLNINIPACDANISVIISGIVHDPEIIAGSSITGDITVTGVAGMAVTYIQEEDGYAYFEATGFLTDGVYAPIFEYVPAGLIVEGLFNVNEQPCYTDTLTNYLKNNSLTPDFVGKYDGAGGLVDADIEDDGSTLTIGFNTSSEVDIIPQDTATIGGVVSRLGGQATNRITVDDDEGTVNVEADNGVTINSTLRVTGSDGVGTRVMLRDADGDVSDATLGEGITLSSGTLAANDTVTTLLQDSILIYSVAGVETGRDTVQLSGTGGGGSGTVTSVGLSLPSQFTVSGSPVTTSGTLTGSWNTQTANTVLAGPTSGAAAAPTFRSLVAADITAGGGVTGSGTTNYLPKWTGSTALGNSAIYDDGTKIGIGTTAPAGTISTARSSADNFIYADTYSANNGHSNYWFSRRSLSNSIGTPLQTAINTFLGVFYFQGVNASNAFQYGAKIAVQQKGTPSSFVPTDIIMSTYNATGENSSQLVLSNLGRVGINQPSPSYILDINGTGGARIPVGTTPQRPTGANGVIRYNSTESLYEGYIGAAYTFFPYMNDGLTQLTAKNYVFNIDQTVGAGQDNYVLTYDNGTGEIQLEANAAPTGSGTTDYVTRWTSSSTLGTGIIRDNGTNVGINQAPGSNKLELSGTALFDAGTAQVPLEINTTYDAGTSYVNIFNAGTTSGTASAIRLGKDNVTGQTGYIGWYYDGTSSADNYLYITGGTSGQTVSYYSDNRVHHLGKTGMGFGVSSPSAILHLTAGTATANTASLKIDEGVNPTTPEDGAINHVSDRLNFTSGNTVNVIAHLSDIPDQNASYYEETLRQYTLTTTGADTIITVDTLALAIGTDSISISAGLIENQRADTVRWQVRYDFYYNSDKDPCYALMDITSDGTEEPVAIPGSAARAEQVSVFGGQMPGRTFHVDVPPGQKIRLCVKGSVGATTSIDISYLTISIQEINR